MENIGRTLREKKQQRGANELKYRELTDSQAIQEAEIQRLTLEQEDNLRSRRYLEEEKENIKVFYGRLCPGKGKKG